MDTPVMLERSAPGLRNTVHQQPNRRALSGSKNLVGTSYIDEMVDGSDEAPSQLPEARKWLGPRGGLVVAGAALALWLYLLVVNDLLLRSVSVIPVALLLGSFAVPSGLIYTMAYRVRSADGFTVRLLLMAFVGGAAASTLAYTPDRLLNLSAGGTASTPATAYLIGVGFVEELLKAGAVVVVAWRLKTVNRRTGLFIGGAVGLGFAAFEDLGYGLRTWLAAPTQGAGVFDLMANTALRAVTGPFAHPLFTAIIAAFIFEAARGGKFRLTWRVVLVFAAVALLHSAWDSLPVLLSDVTHDPAGEFGFSLETSAVIGSIGALIWWRLARNSRPRF